MGAEPGEAEGAAAAESGAGQGTATGPASRPVVGPAAGRADGRVAGVVLAAGLSRRTGPRNKLLLPVDGEPMVRRVAAAGLAAGLDPVVVVTGHEAEAVEAALVGLGMTFAHNDDPAAGLASSLGRGLEALPSGVAGAGILLGDMPWVRPATIRTLAAALDAGAGWSVCVPVHDGRRGNPVVWAAEHFAEIGALRGDEGARVLLVRHRDRTREVAVDDPGILRDVDTLDAWRSPPRS